VVVLFSSVVLHVPIKNNDLIIITTSIPEHEVNKCSIVSKLTNHNLDEQLAKLQHKVNNLGLIKEVQ
jgi:hypothetical protein